MSNVERWCCFLQSSLTCWVLSMVMLGLIGCSQSPVPDVVTDLIDITTVQALPKPLNQLQEVPPPLAIQELRPALDRYQPQVRILSPQANEVIEATQVDVTFAVNDYPLFQDEALGLGPHLHVLLDDAPYTAVYGTDEPVTFSGLAPGTHTIRAFASRPWHESFKNEGAYAEVTFHLYTETGQNSPQSGFPLLTYSRPQGHYGAEPILLDFYLRDAPLHFVANASSDDEIRDWRIRCTVNGERFLLNIWEPIYLQGFKSGVNWVKLELLDENGEVLENAFNPSVRLIEYQPGGEDTLSKLVRGDLLADEVRSIVGGVNSAQRDFSQHGSSRHGMKKPDKTRVEDLETLEQPMPLENPVESRHLDQDMLDQDMLDEDKELGKNNDMKKGVSPFGEHILQEINFA